jgi:transposase
MFARMTLRGDDNGRMDRSSLEILLGRGLSLAEIGRRFDRHEATVAYWVKKHGLTAAHAAKHAARGPMSRAELEPLVDVGLSTRQIGARLGVTSTTVRHWLREHGLETRWAERRRASEEHIPEMTLVCRRHGPTVFRRRPAGGYICVRCRAEAVARRRRRVKRILVEEAGGRCSRCGYDRCIAALAFHHVVPSDKSFSLSHRGVARSLASARAEAAKCVLLCANCHAEVEHSDDLLPGTQGAGVQ